MQQLKTSLPYWVGTAQEPLPNDSQCNICGYFDIEHPDFRRIMLSRDSTGRQLLMARCKCSQQEDQLQRNDQFRRDQAGLPRAGEPRTFESFLPLPGTSEMVSAALQFASRQGPRMLVLVGRTGTGKSHLLEAIGRRALSQGHSTRYDLTPTFLDRLRHTYDSHVDGRADGYQDVYDLLEWYNTRDTLIIDDIGMEQTTPWVREKLCNLIQERHNRGGWLALATNLSRSAMAERFGDRIASRIFAENPQLPEVEVVVNAAEDYRA